LISQITDEDRRVWVQDLKRTYFGDANLDGEFNTGDLVQVFQGGEFEDGFLTNSGWSEGDWDGDLEFDTSDFVIAFQAGGFEQGPRAAFLVPEPNGLAMVMEVVMALAGCVGWRLRPRILEKRHALVGMSVDAFNVRRPTGQPGHDRGRSMLSRLRAK
jgi:hypothetical protein